jgi:small-conductance mechanosensitive channel
MSSNDLREMLDAQREANHKLHQALRAAMDYITKLERDNRRLAKLNEAAGELLAERRVA